MPPTLAAVTAWLDTAPNLERTGDFRRARLDRFRALLRHLPPAPRPCTIAGTKGKGSTTRLIESALVAAGLPTLAFSSPHVVSLAERWRLDGREADAGTLAAAATEVAAIERRTGIPLTWFERTTAMAVLLAPGRAFVLEVGLGGRLDCANAFDAAVLALTHLSHDHRDVLGPTLLHIAREKLALCRPDAPVVIAPQSLAGAIAAARALPRGADAVWVQPPERPWTLALAGAHQQDNAATARAVLARWRPDVDATAIRCGFAQATLPARCQLIERAGRRLLIDGAHNGPSLAATLAVARERLRPPWRLVLGTARDKEIGEMLAALRAGAAPAAVVRCGFASPRARGEADWPAEARSWPWHAQVAAALAGDDDVCVTGSLYLAGETLAWTANHPCGR